MPIRDIFLQLNSHPEPTPDWAFDVAANLASRFSAKITAGLCRVKIPRVSNWLADKLVHADEVIAQENHKSEKGAAHLLSRFAADIGADRRGEAIVFDCSATVTPWRLAAQARVHDLTVLPSYGHHETAAIAESLIFESGRPVLLAPRSAHAMKHVMLAWDGGRAAARALADAIPFCEGADQVTLVMVTGDKDLPEAALGSGAVHHLASHGIEAELVEVPAEGSDAGSVLLAHCHRANADLLVMGAYGHARAREFILGGATRSVLQKAKLPVLFSH